MIAIDTEGSGIGPDTHSILSLGAVDMDDPTRQFYGECRAWDGAHINDEALVVNGFTKEQAQDPAKQSEADLIHAFAAWAETSADRTLGAQNVSYDRDMLEAAARRAKHTQWPFAHRTIDVHTLCWMHIVKRGQTPPVDADKKHSALNLTAVLNYCGVPEEPRPHNALTGAKCHAEVISRLLYDKKLLPEFEQYEIPWLT